MSSTAKGSTSKMSDSHPAVKYWMKISGPNDLTRAFLSLAEKLTASTSITKQDMKDLNRCLGAKYHNDLKRLPENTKGQVTLIIHDTVEQLEKTPEKKFKLIYVMQQKIDTAIKDALINGKTKAKDKIRIRNRITTGPSLSEVDNGDDDGNKSGAVSGKDAKAKYLAKLEKNLAFYEMRLQTAPSKEVDFDDEKSAYLQTAHYMKKYVEAYKIYCDLTGETNCLENDPLIEPKYVWNLKNICPSYPEIERALEKFLISRPCSIKEDNMDAPDYADVLAVVKEVKKRNEVPIPNSEIDNIAETVFLAVMELVKKNTRERLYKALPELQDIENLNDDPAVFDAELAAKLELNKRKSIGEKQVLSDFSHKEDTISYSTILPGGFEECEDGEDTQDEDVAKVEEMTLCMSWDSCGDDDDDEEDIDIDVVDDRMSEEGSETDGVTDAELDGEGEGVTTDAELDGDEDDDEVLENVELESVGNETEKEDSPGVTTDGELDGDEDDDDDVLENVELESVGNETEKEDSPSEQEEGTTETDESDTTVGGYTKPK